MKKFLLSFSSLALALSMAACSSNVVPSSATISGNANMSAKIIKAGDFKGIENPNGDVNYIVDIGNGKKSNASITVKINLASFTTKAGTQSGVAAKTATDIQGIRFWILESPTGTAPTGVQTALKKVDFIGTGGSHTATFTNVPDNTSGKSYYIAAAAYSATPFNTGNNITNILSSTLTFVGENAIISTTGGATANPGSVNVTGSAVSGGAAGTDLGISLKLLDATGATVTGATTTTPGSPCTPCTLDPDGAGPAPAGDIVVSAS